MFLDVLIDSELEKGRKVELVLTEDIKEGNCLAIKVEDGREFIIDSALFEGMEADDYLISKPKRYASKKLLKKVFGNGTD